MELRLFPVEHGVTLLPEDLWDFIVKSGAYGIQKFAAGGGPACGGLCPPFRLWEILSDDGDRAGYVWLDEKVCHPDFLPLDEHPKLRSYLSMAVFAPHQGRKIGTEALRKIISLLRTEGERCLYAQRNSDGRRVGMWLLREGFTLLRRPSRATRPVVDEQYLQSGASPFFFVLRL